MPFDFQSLEGILVCPETHARLVQDGDRLVSVDPNRRLSYPILDDIPIMLIDEATELPEDEWQAAMDRTSRQLGVNGTHDNPAEADPADGSTP